MLHLRGVFQFWHLILDWTKPSTLLYDWMLWWPQWTEPNNLTKQLRHLLVRTQNILRFPDNSKKYIFLQHKLDIESLWQSNVKNVYSMLGKTMFIYKISVKSNHTNEINQKYCKRESEKEMQASALQNQNMMGSLNKI